MCSKYLNCYLRLNNSIKDPINDTICFIQLFVFKNCLSLINFKEVFRKRNKKLQLKILAQTGKLYLNLNQGCRHILLSCPNLNYKGS